MKVYLAAPYAGRDVVAEQAYAWREHGHEPTSGWLRGSRDIGPGTLGISPESSAEEVQAHALGDFADIDAADVLVLYTASYLQELAPHLGSVTHQLHSGGRHVETGYALAKDKPVVVIGEFENIFHRGLCLHACDLDEALSALRQLDNVLTKIGDL